MNEKVISNIKGTRFGNHLYFYLYSYKNNLKVEYVEDMNYWNEFFPKLKSFSTNNSLNFKIFPPKDYYQKHGKYYNKKDINNFINLYLEDELRTIIQSNDIRYDLIINIRRGDFYNSNLINFYGFNLTRYIYDAIELLNKDLIKSVGIISDDLDWCKENLNFLKILDCNIDYLNISPFESFLEIIKAKNIIITNSTFSYWAAYINSYINNDSKVYAPNFNTYIIDMGKQIAATDDWNLIKVYTLAKKRILFKILIDNFKSNLKVFLKNKIC